MKLAFVVVLELFNRLILLIIPAEPPTIAIGMVIGVHATDTLWQTVVFAEYVVVLAGLVRVVPDTLLKKLPLVINGGEAKAHVAAIATAVAMKSLFIVGNSLSDDGAEATKSAR
jgi:hypothetical protein